MKRKTKPRRDAEHFMACFDALIEAIRRMWAKDRLGSDRKSTEGY